MPMEDARVNQQRDGVGGVRPQRHHPGPRGGATAFADPGNEMLIKPTKGSVAFWHSLDRKGFRQSKADHGGCPIMKGSKWILNRWLYYFDNFRDFSCGLHHKELFPMPNGVY